MLSAITAGSGVMGYTLTAAIGGKFYFSCLFLDYIYN